MDYLLSMVMHYHTGISVLLTERKRKIYGCVENNLLHCICDCITPLSLREAMSRYEETPMLEPQNLILSIIKNKFLIAIMETLNEELPEFFFSFLPSGSLRERFARLLPSSSILASDYDLMMIPDAVNVGEEGVSYEGEDVQTPVFRVISSVEHPDAFVWLKLEDKYLTQWEQFCLRRHYKNEGASFLSSVKILALVRATIENSAQIRSEVHQYYSTHIKDNNISVPVEKNGPALTVKVQTSRKTPVCLGHYKENESLLFHADFTFALHCVWPKLASDFSRPIRRRYWPSSHVVDTIKRLGCHLVPKRSTSALVKLMPEQAEYTTYGQSPGLEWRYSFSQAEISLSDAIPTPARTAYLALKAINKRHLNMRGREMKSYPMKCILLYVVEMQPRIFWDSEPYDVAEKLLEDMLERLKVCLESGYCPHYWIPSVNVLELTGSDCSRKLRLLNEIIVDPKKYIADQWLEYTRCVRLNCCYCGPSGLIQQYIPSSEVGDTTVEKPCFCCSCNCSYNEKKRCCAPCSAWRYFDVY